MAAATALVLTGCSSHHSADSGALDLPAGPVTTLPSAADGGPAVTFTGPIPEVAAHYPATVALARFASKLPGGCRPALERSDPRLVSVAWRCGSIVAADTVTLAGASVTLAGIMTGSYAGYLSSTAAEQFSVEGQTHAATSDLSTWYLTPAALAVVFPDGVVTYPLASLQPYLRDPAGL